MPPESEYMQLCRTLAETAARQGNPPVGSVLVQDGQVIAQGIEATHTKGDITAHAEMEAIREAVQKLGKDLSDCVLYSTHEPCVMCGYAIRYHRIRKVVMQSPSLYLGSVTSAFAVLTTNAVPPHWSPPPAIEWVSFPPPEA